MNQNNRRHHSPAEKVRILRMHLLEEKPISEICEGEGIHPTLFYQWQKTFFENGTAAFENAPAVPTRALDPWSGSSTRWKASSDARMR